MQKTLHTLLHCTCRNMFLLLFYPCLFWQLARPCFHNTHTRACALPFNTACFWGPQGLCPKPVTQLCRPQPVPQRVAFIFILCIYPHWISGGVCQSLPPALPWSCPPPQPGGTYRLHKGSSDTSSTSFWLGAVSLLRMEQNLMLGELRTTVLENYCVTWTVKKNSLNPGARRPCYSRWVQLEAG